jgi:chemotaxis protein CheX
VTHEVSALIAITGSVAGLIIYSMSKQTACNLAGKMIGEDVPELDALAQSAIAELANMITGQASIALEKNGYPSDMSPPVLLMGDGSSIATFDLTRLVVPLVISLGEIIIDIAVKEACSANLPLPVRRPQLLRFQQLPRRRGRNA